MPFEKIRAAAVPAGKLIKIKLDNLPGAPEIEMEHLGETNATWMSDQHSRAGTHDALVLTGKDRPMTSLERQKQMLRFRETLAKHAIRHLTDVKHDDGQKATDADIPDWVDALPPDIVNRLISIAFNIDHWREVPMPDVQELAEK